MPKHSGGMSYTRHKYVRSVPQPKIRRFNLGDSHDDYSHVVLLRAISSGIISSGALESARVTANKFLEKSGGGFFLKVLVYPHEVVREHKSMGFAGADRISRGMSKAFGKPVSRAAKVAVGQPILAVNTKENAINVAKAALKRASKKLPITYAIDVDEIVNDGE